LDSSGRFIAFLGAGTNLTTNVVATGNHLYLRDVLLGTTKLIDLGTSAISPSKDFWSPLGIDPSGRFVVFDCTDADLVTNDINQCSDVFLRDVLNDTTELISCHATGLDSHVSDPIKMSRGASLSANGQYAAFCSSSKDIVAGYTNIYPNIFFRDLQAGTNLLVSVDTNKLGGANGASTQCAISGNSRYVVFTSAANNLVTNDNNSKLTDVFVRDLQTGKTTLASANTNGKASGTGASDTPSISLDGRYVLFFSKATNLVVAQYTNGSRNLFLRDRNASTNYALTTGGALAASMTPDGRYIGFAGSPPSSPPTNLYVWDSQLTNLVYTNALNSISRISVSSNGQWLACITGSSLLVLDRVANSVQTVSSGPFGPRPGLHFSADNHWLVYATASANVSADTNQTSDVYLFDLQAGTNELVSKNFLSGNSPNGPSDAPDITTDGRFVVYESLASDIVPGDSNRVKDVFLFDQQDGATFLISSSAYFSGSANYESLLPQVTGDGQTITFQSAASDLAENDFKQAMDIYSLKLFTSTNSASMFVGQILYLPNSPQGLIITWPTTPTASGVSSQQYQLQFKDDLADPDWQSANATITVVGNNGYAKDLSPSPSHRFYRISSY
jgi:hypothetical protein